MRQHQQHHMNQHRRPGLLFVAHGSQHLSLRCLVLFLLASILLSERLFVSAANQDNESEDTMTIEGHLQYANRSPYNLSAEIVVNHGEYTTYSRTSDGNFTIHDIKPGVYIIDIISPIHHFSQVKCLYKPTNKSESLQQQQSDDTTSKKKPVFSCIEYYYPGATKHTIDDSNLLVLTVLASYEYFETKRGFSLLSILKNPMVLMMIFTGGIMYMLPKMMEGMDPEERAMMQKQIQMQQDPTKMMSSLFSGGSTNDDLAGTTSAIRPLSTTTSPEGKSSSNHKQSKRNRK
jgi:ER membrane protein complex subunit 7